MVIKTAVSGSKRNADCDKKLLPSQELAEAMLALCQLIQLRDCYNGDWKVDWSKPTNKYTIMISGSSVMLCPTVYLRHVLAFKTKELGQKFIDNFKSLIETAKPLL